MYQDIDLIKNELIESIRFFIKRQGIVAKALLYFDIDLNMAAKWGALATMSTEGTANAYKSFPEGSEEKQVAQKSLERNLPQIGTWLNEDGTEWNYYLHGGGCMLENIETGEIIDWDCPNLERFDPYFFQKHLVWQMNTFPEKYQHLQKWLRQSDKKIKDVDALISILIVEGRVNKNYTLP